jgi:receptor expression-enhancing protein 5/6
MSSVPASEPQNQQKNPIIKKIDEHLKIIVDKTGIQGKYIMIALGVSLLFTIIGFLDKYITCLVGILLPTFFSTEVIETKEEDHDKLWLTYWTMYAIFSFLDLFTGWILKIIPFYFIIKLVFLVWCFMPNTKGAIIVYDKFIKPFFLKNESKFDKIVNKLLEKTKKAGDLAKNEINKNKEKLTEAGISAADKINKSLKSD